MPRAVVLAAPQPCTSVYSRAPWQVFQPWIGTRFPGVLVRPQCVPARPRCVPKRKESDGSSVSGPDNKNAKEIFKNGLGLFLAIIQESIRTHIVDYAKVPEHLKENKNFGDGDDINSMKG